MDSFTSALPNSDPLPWARRLPLALLVAFALLLARATPAMASDFVIRSAETHLVDHVYLLDASIDYRFSDKGLQALRNGVPLTIRLDMEVDRVRHYWFNATVAELTQRYQLYYHALSDQYLVRNLNSGALYTFPTLYGALSAMGDVHNFPLIDQKLVKPGDRYKVSLRASLDIEALPSPLRPLAYRTPAWHMGSNWYTWSLRSSND